MKKILLTLSVLFCVAIAKAQTTTSTHVVLKGETVTQIAKKYNTTNNVLFMLNPEAVNGISENQILKVPAAAQLQHTVLPKETIYGISKQYHVAIDKLYNLNPGLKENGLKIGQVLNLSNTTTSKTQISNTTVVKPTNITTVIVENGETIYGIAVKNNTTVSVLYELNPGLLENGLKVGQPINVPVSQQPANTNTVKNTPKTIVVPTKATVYSICKTYQITQQQLFQWNPDLVNGLKEGATIIVGYENVSNGKLTEFAPLQEKKKIENLITEKVDLALVNTGATKDLVILLPFNLAKNNFNNPTINQNIKEDVFLNMTLDFYSGAKLAIDHLKDKKYNLNIKFVDSKETNKTLDVNTLKNEFDFTSTDVIIGPFFQRNVDAVSETFKNQQTIVVSPLSTDKGKPYSNQVHTMPTNETVKKEMLEYLLSKEGKIIAITDGKKNSVDYFKTNYPSITSFGVLVDEKVNATFLRNLLMPNVTNYIVYDATSLTTSVELMNTLRILRNDFDIQLVTLEKTDVLDSSDININDLMALKYTFPSVTNDADSSKKQTFTSKYRAVYGKNPSRFAMRGYDVTYDIITRMFEAGEDANIFDYGSQQIENKFAYVKENGGVYNNAVYILYLDNDLTIKEAN